MSLADNVLGTSSDRSSTSRVLQMEQKNMSSFFDVLKTLFIFRLSHLVSSEYPYRYSFD